MRSRTAGRPIARWAITVAVASAMLAGSSATGLAQPDGADGGELVRGAAELSPAARALDPDPREALRQYWTEQRRAAATPVDLPELTREQVEQARPVEVGEPGQSHPLPGSRPEAREADDAWGGWIGQPWPWHDGTVPATTMGKVFFHDTTDGKDHSCSATVINSEGRNLLWTAGHCVHHGQGGSWHTNWVFYPHYQDGPDWTYGVWHASWLATKTKWMDNSDFRYDVGAALVHPNGYGQNIMDVTGGQWLAWNQSKYQDVHSFGYPKSNYWWEPFFDGEKLIYCHSGSWEAGSDVGMNCNMVGGSSGGAWLIWFDGWTGYVNGVNSYGIGDDNMEMYSPYFGSAVESLYNYMRNG
jgi:V8-like Glu-specific endopeptidase